MKNSDYWKERMRILEAARNASNVRLVQRLESEMNAALSEIDDRISGWYRRLSENNEVTISDAKRILRDKELKEFHWTVEEYIRHGEENGIRKNWAKELENASARVHINHLEALKIELRGILEQLGGVQENSTKVHLAEQYADTVYKTTFEVQNGMGVYWNTGKVSREQIETVLSRPWTADVRTFSDRIWMDKDALIDEVYKQLTRSVLLGKGPNDALKAIAKRCQASQYNAGRLVFTESAYIAAEADKQVYKELSVEQFEVDAALDGETCALCGEMDGKHFPMSEYQPGLNAPPFHPNCRCTTVPYFDDDIQERLDKKVGRAARNSGTGKTERVENMTYPEWKEKYVDNDRDSGIIKAGAISGALNPYSDEALSHAERYYESVRHMKIDCERISKNTGYKQSNIEKIKRYIFIEKHILDGDHKRFDPSYDMAQSWQMLIEGKNIRSQDIILLKHEILERALVKRGYTQEQAHIRASKKYNYSKFVK